MSQHAFTVNRAPLDPDGAPRDTAITDDEAVAGARAVVRLFGHWELTDAQARILLGGMSGTTYTRWKRGEFGRIATDLKARLSTLLGIHKALRILYTENDRGYRWISAANAHFDNASPLDVMLNGQISDLSRVRDYLDAARG